MRHECGLDVTYCDKCSDELEESQVGVCSSCKEYTFDELSENAKEEARDKLRYSEGYLGYDWWDAVYEDANRIAKILGLDIETHRRAQNGNDITDIDISFSGFSSQGDGASFRGGYTYNPKAVEEINAYCSDEEPIRIANELTVMQTTQRLLGLDYFAAKITTSGGYSHSHSMDFEITDWGTGDGPDDLGIGEPDENQFAQLMRDFADWIYQALETEHDYHMSDEVVGGYLEEEKFDEFGSMV